MADASHTKRIISKPFLNETSELQSDQSTNPDVTDGHAG
jgi:hypothetical protein